MLAIDTNVVVRLLVRDDDGQTAVAEALLRTENVVVSTPVLLEAAWVLKSVYSFSDAAIAAAFTSLAGLPHLTLADAHHVARALESVAAGLDIADALHLAQSRDYDGFATFDRRLARSAGRLGETSVRLL